MLSAAGIDDRLATHVAHLFVREPLVVYDNRIELNDAVDTDHWENIQSTNWQSVRFKPPPAGSPNIGWRVEFRVMEIQPTDFENAAFAVFISYLAQAIMHYDLNLYIPMSKVNVDFEASLLADAVRTHQYHFRRQIVPPSDPLYRRLYDESAPAEDLGDECERMSANELFNGSKSGFRGLLHLVRLFASEKYTLSEVEQSTLDRYLTLLSRRASGELMTVAAWARAFVLSHPLYGRDSVVSPAIAHDLLGAVYDISVGKRHEPSLYGDLVSPVHQNGSALAELLQDNTTAAL